MRDRVGWEAVLDGIVRKMPLFSVAQAWGSEMRQWRPHLACFVLAIASLVSSHALGQDRNSSIFSQKTTVSDKSKTLFSCRTDQLYRLRFDGNEASKQSYVVKSRQSVKGQVSLTVDVNSRAVTLLLQSGSDPMRAYVLRNVEQGSSLGSGAGGRADTTIRGTSGGNVFTLFAGYDSNGLDQEAALQVGGSNPLLLTCGGSQYAAPQVKGAGRYGSTNIYTLSADSLAQEMKELPVEPDFAGYAGNE